MSDEPKKLRWPLQLKSVEDLEAERSYWVLKLGDAVNPDAALMAKNFIETCDAWIAYRTPSVSETV